MSSAEKQLIDQIKDSAMFVGIITLFGYAGKKVLNENLMGDPSTNVMN